LKKTGLSWVANDEKEPKWSSLPMIAKILIELAGPSDKDFKQNPTEVTMHEVVITNGRIVDGTGNPWYKNDISIDNGMIAEIGSNLKGETEIDASGKVVCPGFIDMHSHTDFILPFYCSMDSFVHQGITTCVVGMCGSSLAPVHPGKEEEFRKQASAFIPFFKDLDITWHTFSEYLTELEKGCVPCNVVPVVGYESIRMTGGPGFEDRAPTPEELATMKGHVKEAMEAGAFGMSTGLIYAPQTYATTEELVELARVVGQYGGLYFSHIRGEGKTLMEAVREFIRIVEESGCRGGQIAHFKVSGKKYWGKSVEALRLVEEANEKGINVTYDSYPYDRGFSSLVTALPPWAREGGLEITLQRLEAPDIRERIKEEIVKDVPYESWENWIKTNGFEKLYVSRVNQEKWKDIEGKSLSEITVMNGFSDEWETLFTLLLEEELGVQITLESMCEDDIRCIMTSRYHMVGTDGLGIPQNPELGTFHPRFFGTYPRILGKYVREEEVLTLEDAVRRMTSFPAQRLGLHDRGVLKRHMWADIVIFDPNIIIDTATYQHPHRFPEGIHHVIVNGHIVLENGEQVDAFPGRVLRNRFENPQE
jgi:N-acyl-D-amino-acid deacylase